MNINRFSDLWNAVYPGETVFRDKAERLIHDTVSEQNALKNTAEQENWFKKAVVYSLYVDFFNRTISGLIEKLPYLEDLGVTCLWLLPVLDSPMLDAGFDIRSYRHIRQDLAASGNPDREFDRFLEESHRRGVRVIFDIALNHCSCEHRWFIDARNNTDSRYRDFFIWSDTAERYREARIIFKGLCSSNWEYDETSDQYIFHRFFPSQPDLNYRNPEVLYEMISVLLSWLVRGIDGFRADAIPYLWKEEGTPCENLPGTHRILKVFRYALETVKPGTLFLAEANQSPLEVVEYLRTEDECNAAYHFPLMPQIFKALAVDSGEPIRHILSPEITPDIPGSTGWLTFLRCHDELTLEMVNPEDRELIHTFYARKPEWDFREGEGIAGRLFTLLQEDADRVILAFTLIFTLPGTPIIYYGDEIAVSNDVGFWEEQRKITGYNDSRYLNRGFLDWKALETDLKIHDSPTAIIRQALVELIKVKKTEPALADGLLVFNDTDNARILSYKRISGQRTVSVICNISRSPCTLTEEDIDLFEKGKILFSNGVVYTGESRVMYGSGVVIILTDSSEQRGGE